MGTCTARVIYLALRRILGFKRDENGEWENIHNDELDSLCLSPNIVRMIESTILRLAEHLVRMKKVGEL